jgi:6-phosphogluconolactonase/glucosamine-6-phosphate isomerase/deaminase
MGAARVADAGTPQVVVVDTPAALADEACRQVLAWLEESLGQRGRARVFLAGGSTPRSAYSLIAADISRRSLPVPSIEWYFGDERWVLPADPQSNEHMARGSLLGPIEAPARTIHSWSAGRGDPIDCARRYGNDLLAEMDGEDPDILLLGIGPDGHTASLFPGATACLPDGRQVPVAPRISDQMPAAAIRGGGAPAGWRLTLCPDFLRTSRHVVFLAVGADKSGPVRRAVDGDAATPAAWIRGATTHFIVTRDAATQQEKG